MLHATGPLLTVDVGTGETHESDVDHVLERFVGGRGVGTRLAHERIPFDADPFGAENRLVFATGPLQSSRTSFTGRLSCTGLSPLTGGLCSSNAGGFLSRNFGATGYSAVELVGASDELVAVHVRDDGVRVEPVPDLRGALTSEVTDHVEERHGQGAEHVACVGPAGENRVRFAAVMTSESRAFGRGGLGAVLGAKNVKLLTFDGDSTPDVDVGGEVSEDDESGEAVADAVHRGAATSDSVMRRQGTAGLTTYADEVGALPTRYFSELAFEGAADVGGDAVEAKKYRKGTCSQCAFACKLPTRDEERGVETEGPEFETVMAFGSNAGVDDVVDVMHANDLCDEFGMDTISCGDTVSAYLASEGAFGDVDLVTDLVGKIARREGVGDLLAEGVDRAHGRLDVENWTAKGMEFAAHDGRTLNGQALAFATSNRGADHLYGSMYVYEYPLVGPDDALDPTGFAGKAERLVETENRNAVLDSAICCRFSRDVVGEDRLAALLDTDVDSLQAVGARVVDLERHFNNRRGFDRRDDALPYDLPGFEAALDEYYEKRGWDDDGTVPRSRVE
ncbi:aldehyde ferredoxin oxidoreductase family protein [Halomarina litorea]|uniref:aldehyde ferredoxin oxidoreductase family protein n=1 Tax=Halomarina litorea TaxID=2961595 RepID=UPI0020C1EA3D|nr:aldehyde ferredoxin oxidoreductase C-terminal domain-containing protein [Halomarina sp. BCD28]